MALGVGTDDFKLIQELYLTKEHQVQMNNELKSIVEKYSKISRQSQETVAPHLFQPFVSFIFTKQYDLWGEILLNK